MQVGRSFNLQDSHGDRLDLSSIVIVAPFSEIKAIWLAFDSLNILRLLIEKIYLKVGSGGWLYLGKVLAP